MSLVRIIGLVLILASIFPAHAVRNKWVDEKGQTHYGDRVPAQYLGKEREILNDQGVVVRKHERLKTKEELTEAQKNKEKEIELNKQKLIANRKEALRDRVLTDTFTTERDIISARDRRIDSITSQINLTETIIKEDEKKLSAIKERIDMIQEMGREVPENTQKSLVSVSRQLETHYQFVETKNFERENILLEFEKDIKRFRELKKQRENN